MQEAFRFTGKIITLCFDSIPEKPDQPLSRYETSAKKAIGRILFLPGALFHGIFSEFYIQLREGYGDRKMQSNSLFHAYRQNSGYTCTDQFLYGKPDREYTFCLFPGLC